MLRLRAIGMGDHRGSRQRRRGDADRDRARLSRTRTATADGIGAARPISLSWRRCLPAAWGSKQPGGLPSNGRCKTWPPPTPSPLPVGGACRHWRRMGSSSAGWALPSTPCWRRCPTSGGWRNGCCMTKRRCRRGRFIERSVKLGKGARAACSVLRVPSRHATRNTQHGTVIVLKL